eukprot:TRINITY_DN13030_c0_g1_i1.p1 TRINITY_DN13030_c0_g1~~TRINITY_DN13030_c0_g1_i1.p1  ORF type:complete len:344 (+),score=51.38 TRINITY_DN13030_c0_g1_i1:13-1044(+)
MPDTHEETLHHAFQLAFRFMVALPTDPQGLKDVTPAERLELYGLWLQYNWGTCRATKNPHTFSIVQSQKWEAWKKVGDITKEEAMERFITKVIEFLKRNPKSSDQELLYFLERRKKSPITLFGAVSDPSTRAITWLCIFSEIPFDFEEVKLTQFPEELRSINTQGRIPFLNDNGLIVNEGTSILKYLCAAFPVLDTIYPKALVPRTQIDQYLDWHNTVLRPVTQASIFGRPPSSNEQKTKIDEVLLTIENLWLTPPEEIASGSSKEKLKSVRYVAGANSPTIADFICYCEVEQIKEGIPWCLEEYPNISLWLSNMKQIKGYEEAHAAYNVAQGSGRLKKIARL